MQEVLCRGRFNYPFYHRVTLELFWNLFSVHVPCDRTEQLLRFEKMTRLFVLRVLISMCAHRVVSSILCSFMHTPESRVPVCFLSRTAPPNFIFWRIANLRFFFGDRRVAEVFIAEQN